MAALAYVVGGARRVSRRLNWELMLVLLADVFAWIGIALLCALWTRVEAAELPAPGAKCTTVYLGKPADVTVQFLEPGAETDPWAWVSVDMGPGRWFWTRVRVSALRCEP